MSPCFVCAAERHKIEDCPVFTSMIPNKRAETIFSNNRCMTCLFGLNHTSKDCRKKKFVKCTTAGCQKPQSHPTLLHGSTFNIKKFIEDKKKDESYATATTSSTVESASEVNRALNSSSTDSTLFKLVPVRVTSGSISIDTYPFIDSGSKSTLIRTDLSKQLGLTGSLTCLRVTTYDGNEKKVKAVKLKFTLFSRDQSAKFVVNGYSLDELQFASNPTIDETTRQSWTHFNGLNLPHI